ncbi:MAG TPA: NUDIX hydrolase [Candidatus Saccharimonadia bacterium]|jgi:ADP-ribose pyrophosphatase YjhB (NUDIX family)|nr:NUDIX hydrolase [Candidatus Saccharimonadia bacterium]
MIECEFENGHKARLRHVVVDVLVLRPDQILLVKRSGKLLEGGKWALPGGFMEQGEDAVAAAQREVLEETGWTTTGHQLLMVNTKPNRPGEDRQNVSLVFVCNAGKKAGEKDWESTDVQWFDLAKLPNPLAFDHADFISHYQAGIKEPTLF